jgi:hypothetical protein
LNSVKYIEGWHWTNLRAKRSMCQHKFVNNWKLSHPWNMKSPKDNM